MLRLKPFSVFAQLIRARAAPVCIAANVLLAATAVSVVAAHASVVSPVGLWRTVDDKTGQSMAEIRITASPAGVLTGFVQRPLVVPGELNCTLCTDDRKDKPKLGMEIIRGAAKVERAEKADGTEVWVGGKILDPDNGKTYTLRLTLIEGGSKLEVRGSMGPFWRTQTWIRIQ